MKSPAITVEFSILSSVYEIKFKIWITYFATLLFDACTFKTVMSCGTDYITVK